MIYDFRYIYMALKVFIYQFMRFSRRRSKCLLFMFYLLSVKDKVITICLIIIKTPAVYRRKYFGFRRFIFQMKRIEYQHLRTIICLFIALMRVIGRPYVSGTEAQLSYPLIKFADVPRFSEIRAMHLCDLQMSLIRLARIMRHTWGSSK